MNAPEHFAPVTDLGHGDALAPWRFLVGPKAQVRLLTAMGDFFLLKPHGFLRRPHVFLLDAFAGQCHLVSDTWEDFKRRMAAPDLEATSWLKFDLLCELRGAGQLLAEGQCFSATVPGFIGGRYELENFEPTPWRVHVNISGQLFEQVKDLPPGTPIHGIDIKWH